ncbi:hypothetical protein BACT_0936 [Bifidobacterium actinocoloniiforme DSM 22766]|uniref:Integral membrane protein n=1 Tax=Bifidobacterium actinocoloniiforme DSM 22766 TaxID=1437605 RepID=A0A086Z134_9BIFI|nr:DUF3043 domain-containing protein [Bifidobacterium actinocoloniiforme]AKV55408.1 membrane protein [Bifidobacterium actinocoloniiforme DSM 22766]KFI40234.1 hypothetical protein BACT_0936 [Bifidobacterium actinocoloniiforme DSM 22766]
MTWKLFKGRDSDDSTEESSPSDQDGANQTEGKGKPTPKRRQAEQRNLRPLVPKDRKASRKAEKARLRAREDAEYEAMRTGDVAHMPKAERLPWRIYIRDYVDARFGVAEFMMPAIIFFFIITMVALMAWPQLYTASMIVMYAYIIAVILDLFVMWRKLKRRLIDKFGERAVAKGSRSASYACMRAWQFRRWRVPKPRYPTRGHWPE